VSGGIKIIYPTIKRGIDIVLSAIGITVLSPVMLITAIAIKLDSPGSVVFKQERLGKNGKIFKIYKFRSMCVNAEKSGVYSLEKDKRITRVGKFIRAVSIDEFLQLCNTIKGDMSLIGPRPPLTYHPWPFDEYTEEQKKMFAVRPGLTGWAQINGRKNVEWNKRIEMNVWYVEHMSLALDVKIFFKTILYVFMNRDNANKFVTVQKSNSEEIEKKDSAIMK
jgi:lipopolysaccharide/colanic/teichoic acid biosynthesis glycosyltransferase